MKGFLDSSRSLSHMDIETGMTKRQIFRDCHGSPVDGETRNDNREKNHHKLHLRNERRER